MAKSFLSRMEASFLSRMQTVDQGPSPIWTELLQLKTGTLWSTESTKPVSVLWSHNLGAPLPGNSGNCWSGSESSNPRKLRPRHSCSTFCSRLRRGLLQMMQSTGANCKGTLVLKENLHVLSLVGRTLPQQRACIQSGRALHRSSISFSIRGSIAD